MAEKYLIKRRRGWAFRIAVPSGLRGRFKSRAGKPLRHITLGLNTDSLAEARKRRDALLAQWRLAFERAATGMALSLPEIDAAAFEVYQSKLDAMADAAARGMEWQVDAPWAETRAEREIAALDIDFDLFIEASNAGDYSIAVGENGESRHCIIANDLAAVQRRTGAVLEPGSEAHDIMCRAIIAANEAALQGRIKALCNQASEPPATFLPDGKSIDPKTLRPIGRARPAVRSSGGLQFREAWNGYLAETQRDPSAKLTEHTIGQAKFVYRLFEGFAGDAALVSIDKAMASGFLDRAAAERKLSNRTLNRYSSALSAVWAWADRRGRHEGANPWQGQWRKIERGTGWLPFTEEELEALFRTLPAGPLGWCMMIGLYSGMRQNEVAQLAVADVRKDHSIWIFDVREGEGQRLKTENAARIVPVHSALIEAGLLDYRASLAEGRLFPELKGGGPDKKPGWPLGRQFTSYRRKCGIERPRVCFHSLRKTFATALDRAGVPQADIAALLGHSRGFSLSVYSSGPGLERLAGLIERIEYGIGLTS